MITVTNLRTMRGLPFDEYLKLDGHSFSSLKFQPNFEPTAKMRLGTAVHNYRAADGSYNGENFAIVKPIVRELNKFVPPAINGDAEISFTCTLTHEGYRMDFRGRIDLLCKDLVIDFKVSENDLYKSCGFFGYREQLTGYALPFNISKSIIIQIHPKTHIITPMLIKPVDHLDFWCKKIRDYGTEIKTIITKTI